LRLNHTVKNIIEFTDTQSEYFILGFITIILISLYFYSASA